MGLSLFLPGFIVPSQSRTGDKVHFEWIAESFVKRRFQTGFSINNSVLAWSLKRTKHEFIAPGAVRIQVVEAELYSW